MGNVNSGRQARKTLVDDCFVLDIRSFRDILADGGGEGSLELRGWPQWRLRLTVRVRGDHRAAQVHLTAEDPWLTRQLDLIVDSRPQRFGSVRSLFMCPVCDRRTMKLYEPVFERGFACRTCHELAYPSQRVDPIQRAKAFAAYVVEQWPEDDRMFERQLARARRAQDRPTTA